MIVCLKTEAKATCHRQGKSQYPYQLIVYRVEQVSPVIIVHYYTKKCNENIISLQRNCLDANHKKHTWTSSTVR